MIIENSQISVAGLKLPLVPFNKQELKGLNIDTLLKFSYYKINFNNQDLCLIHPKGENTLTPGKYKRYAETIEQIIQMPVVVAMDSHQYIDRIRMIEQGIYFIAADKYAFLPSLLINTRTNSKKQKKGKNFSPAAQFILLYCLQNDQLKIFTIKELEPLLPYNYLAISRAISELEQLNFLKSSKKENGTKRISLSYPLKEQWEKAKEMLRNPIKKTIFVDKIPEGYFAISGVNALAYYSHLNPEVQETFATTEQEVKALIKKGWQINETEGKFRIEIWIYPPCMYERNKPYVDKLSLYLSMQEEKDPRVEKELELLINGMKW